MAPNLHVVPPDRKKKKSPSQLVLLSKKNVCGNLGEATL